MRSNIRTPWTRWVTGAVLAGLAGAAGLLAASPAAASPEVIRFYFSDTVQLWTVPAGVHQITVDIIGGAGGDGAGTCSVAGGHGGRVLATLPVTPGEVLSLWVGEGGHLTGAGAASGPVSWYGGGNGGGAGASLSSNGGGGGGASVMWRGYPVGNDTTLLVAGGGGGGGGQGGTKFQCGGRGGDGGKPAAAGEDAPDVVGQGGLGGYPDRVSTDHRGYDGETIDSRYVGGGGGGGGSGMSRCFGQFSQCYGVGEGGATLDESNWSGDGGGGGAGGSSYAAGAASNVTYGHAGSHGATGQIIVSYGQPTVTSMLPATGRAGHPVTLRALVEPSDGGGTVSFASDGVLIPGCDAAPLISGTGTIYSASCATSSLPAGEHQITAVYSGNAGHAGSSGTGSATISQPTSTTLSIDPASPVPAGAALTLTASVSGSAGLGIARFLRDDTPIPGCEAVSLDTRHRATCATTAPAPGGYHLRAEYSGSGLYEASGATADLTTVDPIRPLSITTSALPVGTKNRKYAVNLAAAGGVGAYQWSLASGTLPAGLTLSADGVLAGKPTAAGNRTVTVRVSDMASPAHTATKQLTLSVTTAPKPDLSVKLTAPAAFRTGRDARYKIVVMNGGNVATTQPIAVTDTLPAGLTFVSTTDAAWTCTAAGLAIACTRTASLTAGASVTLWLTVHVAAPAGTVLRNTVHVGPTDATEPDNTSTNQLTVTP